GRAVLHADRVDALVGPGVHLGPDHARPAAEVYRQRLLGITVAVEVPAVTREVGFEAEVLGGGAGLEAEVAVVVVGRAPLSVRAGVRVADEERVGVEDVVARDGRGAATADDR